MGCVAYREMEAKSDAGKEGRKEKKVIRCLNECVMRYVCVGGGVLFKVPLCTFRFRLC